MKKIIVIAAIIAASTASAGFGFFNNNGYNGYTDNGIFAFNGFSMFDPRWYTQEFTNMVNEFDSEFTNNNNNNYGYSSYSYKRKSTHNFPIK